MELGDANCQSTLLVRASRGWRKFAQEDNLPMVAMFTAITIFAVVTIVALFKFG